MDGVISFMCVIIGSGSSVIRISWKIFLFLSLLSHSWIASRTHLFLVFVNRRFLVSKTEVVGKHAFYILIVLSVF